MKNRCSNPNGDHAQHYYERGIKVCNEWISDFEAFEKWAVTNGYTPCLTIDRIDVDGNYTPDNCRFVDSRVQANNRRNNKCIELDGIRLTYAQWSKKLGAKDSRLVAQRINNGWTEQEAVTIPLGGKRGARLCTTI